MIAQEIAERHAGFFFERPVENRTRENLAHDIGLAIQESLGKRYKLEWGTWGLMEIRDFMMKKEINLDQFRKFIKQRCKLVQR